MHVLEHRRVELSRFTCGASRYRVVFFLLQLQHNHCIQSLSRQFHRKSCTTNQGGSNEEIIGVESNVEFSHYQDIKLWLYLLQGYPVISENDQKNPRFHESTARWFSGNGHTLENQILGPVNLT